MDVASTTDNTGAAAKTCKRTKLSSNDDHHRLDPLPFPSSFFQFYAFHISMLESLHQQEDNQQDATIIASLLPILQSFVQQREKTCRRTTTTISSETTPSSSSLLIPQKILALQQAVDATEYEQTVAPWRAARARVQILVDQLRQQRESLVQTWWEEEGARIEQLVQVHVIVSMADTRGRKAPPSERVEKLRMQIELWEKLLADFRSVLGTEE